MKGRPGATWGVGFQVQLRDPPRVGPGQEARKPEGGLGGLGRGRVGQVEDHPLQVGWEELRQGLGWRGAAGKVEAAFRKEAQAVEALGSAEVFCGEPDAEGQSEEAVFRGDAL